MIPLPRSPFLVPINLVTVEILEADGRCRTYRSFPVPIDSYDKYTDFTEVLSFLDHWQKLYPSHLLILHFEGPDKLISRDMRRMENAR